MIADPKSTWLVGDFSMEDMIPNESVVLTISHAGYIKRTPLKEYKIQNRGGVGQKASTTRDEDFLEYIFSGTNHQYILFFTQKGKCFWMQWRTWLIFRSCTK